MNLPSSCTAILPHLFPGPFLSPRYGVPPGQRDMVRWHSTLFRRTDLLFKEPPDYYTCGLHVLGIPDTYERFSSLTAILLSACGDPSQDVFPHLPYHRLIQTAKRAGTIDAGTRGRRGPGMLSY